MFTRSLRVVLMREQKIDRNREHLWVIGLAADNTDPVGGAGEHGIGDADDCRTDGDLQPCITEKMC